MKVLVVDDTVVYRKILSDIVGSMPDATLCGTASNGRLALAKMSQEAADVVLLDIEMPEMDGIETLRELRRQYPQTGVIMVSAQNRHSADITIRALEVGALDFIPKPDGNSPEENVRFLKQQLHPIFRNLGIRRSVRSPQRSAPPSSAPVAAEPMAPVASASSVALPPRVAIGSRSTPNLRVNAITIGISTGGPNALNDLIPLLPHDLNVPIFIVQHMPPVFTASLASHLDNKSQLHVKEAEDGEIARPNVVYVAPGGRHMVVEGNGSSGGQVTIRLNDQPPENSCRPAADVLFRSIRETYGKHVLAAVMTGMGSDGAKGVQGLKQAGAYCLTQSERSCVVYGMPRAVDELHLSDERVDLKDMARRMTELVRGNK